MSMFFWYKRDKMSTQLLLKYKLIKPSFVFSGICLLIARLKWNLFEYWMRIMSHNYFASLTIHRVNKLAIMGAVDT